MIFTEQEAFKLLTILPFWTSALDADGQDALVEFFRAFADRLEHVYKNVLTISNVENSNQKFIALNDRLAKAYAKLIPYMNDPQICSAAHFASILHQDVAARPFNN